MMNNPPKKNLALNIEQNSQSLNITSAIYLRILKRAVQQTSEDIKQMEAALPINDFEVIKAVSHKLKGDYDNLRLSDLSNIARKMEEVAKNEQDNEKILEFLNEFIVYFEQLKQVMI